MIACWLWSESVLKPTLNLEIFTSQLKSQLILNSITTHLPLTLSAHLPTIIVVLATSCMCKRRVFS
jgi:hypothetical protein